MMINSGVIRTNAITFIAQKTSFITHSPCRGSLGREKDKLVSYQEESEKQASVLSSMLKSLPELGSFHLTAWSGAA